MHWIVHMNRSPKKIAVILSFTCLTAAASGAGSFDWPQWRGPDRTHLSQETGLLKSWPAAGPKRAWLFENAGQGYSGPAIVGGKLFILGTRDESECLLALNADTGRELWMAKIGSIHPDRRGNGPRGTPSVDGDRVYAMTGQGILACASLADGKIRWQKSMTDLGGRKPGWGFSESVLVDGDQVVCTPGGAKGALAAFDKMNGKLLWQSTEFTEPAHYSSIIPVELHGTRQYVQLVERSLVGIAAQDGKLLWKSPWPGRTAVVPTPIYRDGHVYITSDYGVGCKLVRVGTGQEVSDVYENKVMKNHHGGVVLVGDHLYGYSGNTGWICQNFMTGEEVWVSKRLGKGAVAYADGMLYCLDERNGTVALIEASPKGWQERGRFRLDPQSKITPRGGVWTHPVVCHGKLYLRDQDLIYCYDIKAN